MHSDKKQCTGAESCTNAMQGYDQTIVPLVVMIILVALGALGSLLGLMVFHARAAVYARPLNYHVDVLNQQ